MNHSVILCPLLPFFFSKFCTAVHFSLIFCSPDLFDGYLCFVISIFGIGCLTAVIGDVASHFGCTVGLKDAITAVAFVALGTSVPGKATGPFSSFQHQLRTTPVLLLRSEPESWERFSVWNLREVLFFLYFHMQSVSFCHNVTKLCVLFMVIP
jgi:hypothetical protein